MDTLFSLIEPLQSFLFQQVVLPLLYGTGFMSYAEDGYTATGYFLLGILQIAVAYALLRPLEAWRPVERWTDRRLVRADVIYTWLRRSGALPLLFFVLLQPLLSPLDQALRGAGYLPPNLERLAPGVTNQPLIALMVYLVVIDFFEYWRHRMQHRFAWWWALHSTHHSQRQMSLWTDDRNHLLDSLIESLWFALLALIIGIPPAQFVAAVLTTNFVESLAHANVRLNFGPIGDRILVSPSYHRVHHAIGLGHEGPARGCNFATLFPAWDSLFGTAEYRPLYLPTGVRDRHAGADYGTGFWSQQTTGVRRLLQTFTRSRSTAGRQASTGE
jgi:sterol desaturase/sphingolipid hydroxylase (fatty acid hydroxylase superfamily)